MPAAPQNKAVLSTATAEGGSNADPSNTRIPDPTDTVSVSTSEADNAKSGTFTDAPRSIEADIAKRVDKTRNSLTKRANEAGEVADKLAKGDVEGAVRSAGDTAKERADRLGKDINNGVKKVESAVKKVADGVKKATGGSTAKKPDSGASDSKGADSGKSGSDGGA